jgi:DNA-binding response OmpR family regulator
MRILVIEDERRLSKALTRGLELSGFAVDTREDGREAFEHLLLHHSVYDLVILDLMLPGMDGREICTALRDRKIGVPILVLSAKDQTVDKIVLLNAGADDYMTKPFALGEVIARGNALMRRPDHAYPSELTCSDLRIDVGNHSAYLKEVPLSLTVKEFSILEYLMRHPDQVVDRERILDHVWDFNFNSFSNVVDVHIKNLRRKLKEANPDDEYIETINGVGYRLKT